MNTRGERRPMTLQFRLGVIAVVFLAMVVVAVGLSALMLRSWNQTIDDRADLRAVADDVAGLRLAYSDQLSGLRGFELVGDESYLEPYREGVADEQAVVAHIRASTVMVDDLDDAVAAAVAAGETWRTEVATPVINGTDIDHGRARASFEAVRTELERLDRIVSAELAELAEDEEQVRRNAIGVIVGSIVAAVAATVLAALLFRRWVTRPLGEISDAARALIDDDTYPIPEFAAPELEDVSAAVGSLQRSLSRARDAAVANYHALEQSAVLAIQVRSELADNLGDLPDGWRVSSLLQPAEGLVAGDCFDVGLLDQNHMYAILIDVTGHGAPAALNALKAKSQLRAALRSRLTPGAAIDWLSREMLRDDRSDILTLSVVVIDVTSGRVRFANAGHPPALITDGSEVIVLDQPGPIVGAFEGTWPTGDVQLPPGWSLLTYTDGITEAVGADRERFGEQRLFDCLTTPDPDELLHCIDTELTAFRTGDRTDDITAIAIHRLEPETFTVPIVDRTDVSSEVRVDGASDPGTLTGARETSESTNGNVQA